MEDNLIKLKGGITQFLLITSNPDLKLKLGGPKNFFDGLNDEDLQ